MLSKLKRSVFSGRINKAWAAVLAPAIVTAGFSFFGVAASPELHAALVSIITGAAVWTVPNAS